MNVAGKAFAVSGGASGLGAATAEMLVGAGAHVLIIDRDVERGEAEATRLGHDAVFAKTDVTDDAEGAAAIAMAVERFGGLHGLVCCAGVAPSERVLGRSGMHGLDSFVRAVSVNLVGTFNLIRHAAEAMSRAVPDAEGERGVIVCTASVAAFDGQIGQAAYAASKGGVTAMTLPLARELARHGIRVVTIAPGVFETPMMAGFSVEVQGSLAKSVPFPSRLGRPAEFASLVKHICENSMLNGEVIRLDGALRMAAR